MAVVLRTEVAGLPSPMRGKVRDVYPIGDDRLLLVATDRLSAFDVVMGEGIPDKGRVLTALAAWWFGRTAELVPNHLISIADSEVRSALESVGATWDPMLSGRSMLCRRTQPLPVEAVVRGYLSGSAWKEYRRTGGDLWGHRLPTGLVESDRLPTPIFTPSTKATAGHDQPLTTTEAMVLLGDRYRPVETASLALYDAAGRHAADRGILLADTKFEFGIGPDGALVLIDEILTPDSSRFWPADAYAPGGAQPSFDKQFV
ncbi:MAG: phosphoribosylaminoimidazolesuccinocarboxamide synthase, partial [Armatimonadota bacterium]